MTCWWLTGPGWVSLLAKPTVYCHLLGEPAARSTALPVEMVESLTAREMDVLRLLCEGRSNHEIATILFLSLSAVKKYTGNLYGKLGVTSRAQAIVKAHDLRLV